MITDSGHGFGYGVGGGYGSGDGHGEGYGYGDGHGYGYGDGYGSGSGYGEGYGFATLRVGGHDLTAETDDEWIAYFEEIAETETGAPCAAGIANFMRAVLALRAGGY